MRLSLAAAASLCVCVCAGWLLLPGVVHDERVPDVGWVTVRQHASAPQVASVYRPSDSESLRYRRLHIRNPLNDTGNLTYSRFRCVGDDNVWSAWKQGRMCVFNNVVLELRSGAVFYYRKSVKPTFFDQTGKLYTFRKGKEGIVSLSEHPDRAQDSWGPDIVEGALPVSREKQLRLHNLHLFYRTKLTDFNLGHFLWEDLASMFIATHQLGVYSDEMQVLHFLDIRSLSKVQARLYTKYLDAFQYGLSRKPVVRFGDFVANFSRSYSYIWFDALFVGGFVPCHHPFAGQLNFGKEPLFYAFRSSILRANGFDPAFQPREHQITMTLKTDAYYSHRIRAIDNFDEVVAYVRAQFPSVFVRVVEWHKLDWHEQFSILLNTTLLITPAGGVSSVLPFLPDGAHAIVVDYYSDGPKPFGYPLGTSVSMEAHCWNHWPHVKKDYYQVYSLDEHVKNKNMRTRELSVRVKVDRLREVMDLAFEEMEPCEVEAFNNSE